MDVGILFITTAGDTGLDEDNPDMKFYPANFDLANIIGAQAKSRVMADRASWSFARSGARDVIRAGFCRNMVFPVPAQRVIIDCEFSRGGLDRCARANARSARAQDDCSPDSGRFAKLLVVPSISSLCTNYILTMHQTLNSTIQPNKSS
jgi:hypothetical protein